MTTTTIRGIGMTHSMIDSWVFTGEVVDAEPIKRLYHKARFYPDHIAVEYERANGTSWELLHLTLSGPGIAQGKRSKNSMHTEIFKPWSLRYAPEWAREWAEAKMPNGADPEADAAKAVAVRADTKDVTS